MSQAAKDTLVPRLKAHRSGYQTHRLTKAWLAHLPYSQTVARFYNRARCLLLLRTYSRRSAECFALAGPAHLSGGAVMLCA